MVYTLIESDSRLTRKGETIMSSDLTYKDAVALVETLQADGIQWRHWSKRSDSERLAIGIVILQKHLKGKSMRTIGEELDVPYATCQRYKERALQAITLPTVEEARKEELGRLDAIIAAIWPRVEEGDKDAVASYMKVSERKAKMLGWDKPIEVNQTVTEISAQEMELKQIMEQAERDSKMQEMEILDAETLEVTDGRDGK